MWLETCSKALINLDFVHSIDIGGEESGGGEESSFGVYAYYDYSTNKYGKNKHSNAVEIIGAEYISTAGEFAKDAIQLDIATHFISVIRDLIIKNEMLIKFEDITKEFRDTYPQAAPKA